MKIEKKGIFNAHDDENDDVYLIDVVEKKCKMRFTPFTMEEKAYIFDICQYVRTIGDKYKKLQLDFKELNERYEKI